MPQKANACVRTTDWLLMYVLNFVFRLVEKLPGYSSGTRSAGLQEMLSVWPTPARLECEEFTARRSLVSLFSAEPTWCCSS